MADYKPSELLWLANSPAFSRAGDDSATARQWRGETTADWMEAVFKRMYGADASVEDFKPQTAAIEGHTVESMVEELKQRVGLDVLEKKAAAPSKVPLSKRANEAAKDKKGLNNDLISEMKNYLITYHLRPGHGMTSSEALFDALKDKYGPDKISEIGREPLLKIIEDARKQTEEPSMADGLPKYDGRPIPVKEDSDDKKGPFGQSGGRTF